VNAICRTCGTQYAASDPHPSDCAICLDERQYVGLDGQTWTTLDELRASHKTIIQQEEPGLTSLTIEPRFAIGQRAFLIQTGAGNILWDCISLLDGPTIGDIQSMGGIAAICISHPHYYTTMVEWSRTFANAPVYLHGDDAEWVMRSDERIHFWEGETKALPGGVTAIRCGGHFAGGTVLHWPDGAGKKGALLSGDIIQVVPDTRFVSFMWSYPNYIPLNAASVERIAAKVEPYAFDRIYGAFPKMTVASNAKDSVRRSAERYLNAIR
jgi:glyoxylase-like metal-dependent hydrolase (beta-lactamase superfamily II)